MVKWVINHDNYYILITRLLIGFEDKFARENRDSFEVWADTRI